MKAYRHILFAGIIILFLSACSTNTPTPVVPAPLSAAGRLLAAQCAQCHGTDGVSSTDIEGLAGESKAELVEEMLEMKNSNENSLMMFQAHGYSTQQIDLIADYFSKIQHLAGND